MDKEEFAQVVWESQDTMYRVAKSILKKDMDCEDAVSQAIVNAFEHLDTLKRPEYAKTWLVRIVINECCRISRQRKREQCYEEEVICIGNWRDYDGNWQTDDYSELYEALQEIPQSYRTALVLYYLEDYTMAEIARFQKASLGAVKMRLSRGRKMLKKMLKETAQTGQQTKNVRIV